MQIIGYAQYNLTYDFGALGTNGNDLFYTSLCITTDSIVNIPGAVDQNGNLISTLTKVDLATGNAISTIITADTSLGNADYGGGGILALNNCLYICGWVVKDSTKAYLYKIDANNNITRFYYDFGAALSAFSGYDIIYKNNKLFLVGGIQFSPTNAEGLLAVLDTNGNVLDYRTYGGSGFELLNSIDTTTDGGFILGGWTESYGTGLPFYADAYIVKTDSSLNEQWYRTWGNASSGEACTLTSSKDGFITAGKNDIPETPFKDPYINKYNNNGDLLWEYFYVPSAYTLTGSASFYSPIELLNGNIVVIGGILDTVNHSVSGTGYLGHIGLFQLLNENGDTLYSRKLKIRKDENYLNCIISTDDGGFLISGYVFPDDTSNTQDGWLIKLDSNYCEIDSCIGYEHPNPIPIPKPAPLFTNGDWLFYPNPSTAGFTIVPPQSMVLLDNYTVYVYNYLGQEIVNTKSIGWAFIETATWASGLYTVRILDSNNKDLYCGKVIVNK